MPRTVAKLAAVKAAPLAPRRWWRAFALAALAALGLWAAPAAALAGVDDEPLVVDGPWIIEVGPEVAVIAGPAGSFTLLDGAARPALACEATYGCAAVWDESVGAVVIVDQSTVAPASAPSPAAPASPTAASPSGAAPR